MENRYKMVALLPMKSHSERVPGKNFKNFLGKPLFKWILEALVSTNEFDQIIINSDAIEELQNHGIDQYKNVTLRERPMEIRGDHVSMNKVIQDDITNVNAQHYLMTHTTNPLISSKTISESISRYYEALKSGYDSLFTVNKYQSRFYGKDIQPINHDPDNLIRTQDLDPIYEENSCLYLFSKESFIKANARIGTKPTILSTPYFESVDIDDHKSWKLAEIFSKNKHHLDNEI